MNKLIALSASLLTLLVAHAENVAKISTVTPEGRTVVVEAINPNVLKVSNLAPGEVVPVSQTIIAKAEDCAATVQETAATAMLLTETGVAATLDRSTGALTITSGRDRGLSDNGLRQKDADGRTSFTISPVGPTRLHGAGERGYSFDLSRPDTLTMFNKQNYGYTAGEPRIRQMNITMPLLVSPNGYAVVFDDYAAAELLTGPQLRYATESPAPVSYYYVNSPEGFSGITSELTALTGRQELPPRWSLGYITSKYGYRTQDETEGVVDTLRRAGYPVDGIVLDLYWYGKEEDMGRLEWEPSQWPDHRKMLSDLKKKGVNLVAISQPYVLFNGRAVDNFNNLSARGMFGKNDAGVTDTVTIWVGRGGMFDVSNPETRQWLRDRYKLLTDEGITGWWGDLGEPEVHPETMRHANGLTARQYHNLYGNDWSRIVYDLFAEDYPDTRLMTLMRGGTVGLQRYSVYPWSTDVSRSWGGLRPQVTIMLNSGLSGLGYMSHDVGGFAIDPENPVDPELYVRWLQLGTFSPILRTHAQQVAEPYKYPEQQHIILPLVLERYRWLPYNYTLAYENATAGTPLVRPIGFYEPDAGEYSDVDDEYLWGADVLVAPVLTQGATTREVRFPSGKWVDLNDPQKVYDGPTTATVDAPLEVLPMFVRAGALIPTADYKMANTGDFDNTHYTVNYYPTIGCGESSFTLFEDDGTTRGSVEKGNYALINFEANDSPNGEITLRASLKEGTADTAKRLTFKVYGLMTAPKSVVTADGRKVKFTFADGVLTLRELKWLPSTPLQLTIR